VRNARRAHGLLGFVAQDILYRTQEAGLGLLVEHAATPGVKHVGRIGRLQQRRELGLESLVLQERQFDLDIRVLRHEVGGDGIHQLHFRRDRRDVQMLDYGLSLGRHDDGQSQHCGKRNMLHVFLLSHATAETGTRSPPWPRH